MIFPFYEKAKELWANTQKQQIIKGLKKYPEPFNPHSWTPEELLNHALEETVDLTHYLVGLKELLDAKDKEIRILKNNFEMLKSDHNYLIRDYEALKNKPNINFEDKPLPVIPYFDPDDQH
jgi:hypothetical protein